MSQTKASSDRSSFDSDLHPESTAEGLMVPESTEPQVQGGSPHQLLGGATGLLWAQIAAAHTQGAKIEGRPLELESRTLAKCDVAQFGQGAEGRRCSQG